MQGNKKFITIAILTAMVFGGVAAVKAPLQKERNLKVLPIDISDEKLDSIMQTYNIALGVKCNFCHVPYIGFIPFGSKDTLDYASDKEPLKETARKMMRMVITINSENFWFNKNEIKEYLHTVTCKTCHRGEAYPPEN